MAHKEHLDDEVFGPGIPLEKLKDDPILLELALVQCASVTRLPAMPTN